MRRLALAAVLAGALGAACASAPPAVHLSDQWPAQAGEYHEVTRRWTRRANERSGSDDERGRIFEQTVEVFATFKSPEWRAAYVKYRAAQNRLPPSEVAALTRREKAEDADHYEVMLLVATYDRRVNELQKGARSIWRLALVDESGAEIVASEIRRDRRPRSEIAAEFPNLGDFHEPYVARFPRKVNLLRAGVHRFSLKLTSSQVGVEMVWTDPSAPATASAAASASTR
ncbi:MAG TPA: hypothetical protein VK698_09785 [Kofleriaceae bacterium]|nr:hypothetical protein [Kofleriaceae bacterium]